MTTPKKSLGQNFLRDPKILKKIVESAQTEKNTPVIEVGPGEGTLTEFLLEKTNHLTVVEKDEELAKKLELRFAKEVAEEKLKIINDDILNYFDNEILISDYFLVGNIPYYLTGALFKKVLEIKTPPRSITFVIQKEVAQRILAKDKKESILSIAIKAYGEPRLVGIIKAGSFYPKPKVDSAILNICNINKNNFESKEVEQKFFTILKTGFAHKRKLLLKNLKDLPKKNFLIENLENIFKKTNLTQKVRAEDLTVGDWLNLTKFLVR
jgi:16S rRNA (adenine1518-N6/adenine1519-N6)-dimethyltransferase